MDAKSLPVAGPRTGSQPEFDPYTLYSQNRDRLFSVAFSWCKDSALAEDIVQETLIKAMQRIDQLKREDCQFSWMYSILSNCLNDHYRRCKNTVSIDDYSENKIDTLCHNDADPVLICLSNQVTRIVRRMVRDLPVQQRSVLALVDLDEYSYSEAADALGIPIGTVMSRLSRARRSLKEKLLPLK